jgi:hypothetical protein
MVENTPRTGSRNIWKTKEFDIKERFPKPQSKMVWLRGSMILDANLSNCYWVEAVSTAAYLKNRCPTRAEDTL